MRHAWIVFVLAGCFSEPGIGSPSSDDGSSSSTTTLVDPSMSSISGAASHSAGGSVGTGDVTGSLGATGTSGGGSTDAGSSEGSSTGDVTDGYADCFFGPIAEGKKLCLGSCVVTPPEHSACAPACGDACPEGPEGSATACLGEIADGVVALVCIVSCAGAGAPCPLQMACSPTEFTAGGATIWACMWP